MTLSRHLIIFPCLTIFMFTHPSPANANLLNTLFGFSSSRPPCTPVNASEYNPDAYSQVADIQNDCSNYGFGLFAGDVLPYTSVTTGNPINAVFKFFGDPLEQNHTITINQNSSMDTQAITSLTQSTDNRANTPASARMAGELGSLFTNTRAAMSETLRYVNTGINLRLRPQTLQIRDRYEYCQFLLECQQNPNADLPELTSGGIPTKRCINPMPYDMYPQDPYRTEIAMEDVVCRETIEKMGNLDDPAQFFTPANWLAQKDFITKFLALDPTYKARDLIVVCTDKVFGTEVAPIAAKFYSTSLEHFDCQEVIIPPGLVAACQGVWNQLQAITPIDKTAELEAEMNALRTDPSNTQARVVSLGSLDALLSNIHGSAAYRKARYALRINAEFSNPNAGKDTVTDLEKYGEANQEIETFGTINTNTNARIDDPDEPGITYTAKRTFTIAPIGFDICFNELLRQHPYSASNAMLSASIINSPAGGESREHIPHELSIDTSTHETEQCEFELDENGVRVRDDEGNYIRRCRTFALNYSPTFAENKSIVTRGAGASLFALINLKSAFTSFFDSSSASDRTCGWDEYKRGLPPPPGCNLHSRSNLSCNEGELPPLSTASGSCGLCSTFLDSSIPPLMRQIIESAAEEYQVPASLILGIMYSEGGFGREWCYGNWHDIITESSVCGGEIPRCRECNVSSEGALGPFQWIQRWMPTLDGRYNMPSWYTENPCNFSDAVYATAGRIKFARVGSPLWEDTCTDLQNNRYDIHNGDGTVSTSCSGWTPDDIATVARAFLGYCDPEQIGNVLWVTQCNTSPPPWY